MADQGLGGGGPDHGLLRGVLATGPDGPAPAGFRSSPVGRWLAEAWPPQFDDLPLILQRTAETIAMAAMGTTIATLLAVPTAVLASRNITPVPYSIFPCVGFSICCAGSTRSSSRCCSSPRLAWVPSPGARHWPPHLGQLCQADRRSDRNRPTRSLAGGRDDRRWPNHRHRLRLAARYCPAGPSTTLFWWEFNVRASTVLGVVGAGGNGRNSRTAWICWISPGCLRS